MALKSYTTGQSIGSCYWTCLSSSVCQSPQISGTYWCHTFKIKAHRKHDWHGLDPIVFPYAQAKEAILTISLFPWQLPLPLPPALEVRSFQEWIFKTGGWGVGGCCRRGEIAERNALTLHNWKHDKAQPMVICLLFWDSSSSPGSNMQGVVENIHHAFRIMSQPSFYQIWGLKWSDSCLALTHKQSQWNFIQIQWILI